MVSLLDEHFELEPDPDTMEVYHDAKQDKIDEVMTHSPILHHVPDNLGLDTSSILTPKLENGPEVKHRLLLDTEPLSIHPDIPVFLRQGKKQYKEVNYKLEYTPPEFVPPNQKTNKKDDKKRGHLGSHHQDNDVVHQKGEEFSQLGETQ